MFEWNQSVQKMIDIIEDSLTEEISLKQIADKLHYSSYYCTRQFHEYVGVSLRNYIRLRKLSRAALELRDTAKRIIDIAFKYGYTSQEAFTRSFSNEFGLTPSSYRNMKMPLPLFLKRNVYNPYILGIKRNKNLSLEHKVKINIQVIPLHQFIGIKDIETNNYYDFWDRQETVFNRDCYEVSGILESIKSYNGILGGWFYQGHQKGYLYGVEVPNDTEDELPEYFERIKIKESLYVVFHYPPYDYNEEDHKVMELINDEINQWNPLEYGYQYHKENPIYQRHNPFLYGQAICIPIKKIET